MNKYKQQIKDYIDTHTDEMITFLTELISYKSVEQPAEEGMPFGKECAAVLNRFTAECERFGFTVKNFDNYAAHADMNALPAELGILCHLDVVPEGTGWSGDPYTARVTDDKIIGRGAVDDKGPAAAALFAMRCISELNIPLKGGVRIITGCNEENGSADMEYYRRHENFPPLLITPDGNYPVINIEKGMLRCKMTADISDSDIIMLKGGEVINAVPEKCTAAIKNTSAEEVLHLTDSISGVKVSSEDKNGITYIYVDGVCAHASTPEQGVNAVTAMLAILSCLKEPLIKGEAIVSDTRKSVTESGVKRFNQRFISCGQAVKALSELFPFGETDGASAGIKCSDDRSGALTAVLSVIEIKDGKLYAYADSRFPVSRTLEEISGRLCGKAAEKGLSAEIILGSEPHYVDSDSDFIRTLLSVYEDITGEHGECIAIGGGTYVHDTENGVAFGAEFPGEDNHMHGADEFIKISSLKLNAEIYANAIAELLGDF